MDRLRAAPGQHYFSGSSGLRGTEAGAVQLEEALGTEMPMLVQVDQATSKEEMRTKCQ